jgi:hypothetical protein
VRDSPSLDMSEGEGGTGRQEKNTAFYTRCFFS